MLNKLIDKFQEAFPINRLVVLATPFFVAAAGYISMWAADNMPGIPPLDQDWLAGTFIAGALLAGQQAYKWLDGWQKQESSSS